MTRVSGIMVGLVLLVACGPGRPPTPTGGDPTGSATFSSAVGAGASLGPRPGARQIQQPSLKALNARTRRRLAPSDRRVDLAVPSFSDPTNITNPLFPIGDLTSAVLIGRLHGLPWRAETTLLPDTQLVAWNGQQVETRQSQFVAYLNGRIFEVAVDRYAQADDGSVWYFGEDAFTYRRGRVADTEGTWLAGVTGPPAMIMPGHPQVGDVYRAENIPGLVFEQVTVQKVGATVDGPLGPIAGAMVAQELHMDEARLEAKFFAPGYGEFFSGSGSTFEANALAVPADALPRPVPVQLQTIAGGSTDLFDAARAGDRGSVAAALGSITAAWRTFRTPQTPGRLASEIDGAIGALAHAVGRHDLADAATAAIRLDLADLDLELRYRSASDVNVARFDAWTRQLQLDVSAHDRSAVVGDVTTLMWIRDRIALDATSSGIVDDALRSLQAQAEAGEPSAGPTAARLRDVLSSAAGPA